MSKHIHCEYPCKSAKAICGKDRRDMPGYGIGYLVPPLVFISISFSDTCPDCRDVLSDAFDRMLQQHFERKAAAPRGISYGGK